MHMDPMMPTLVGVAAAVILVGLLMRALRQPAVIVYLLAGVVLGPSGMQLLEDQTVIARIGDVGVVLLLFFVGMHVQLDELVSGWRVAFGGTVAQVLASVAVVWAVGAWLGWPHERILLLGFVIALSSTALVVTLLKSTGELHEQVGRDALGILIVQDLFVIGMLLVLSALGEGTGEGDHDIVVRQLVGGAAAVGWVVFLLKRKQISLPLAARVREDEELQVFAAFFMCFGFAVATGYAGLSAALGAFIAGLTVGATKDTEWIHRALAPFRVLLVALFFVSVGMLIDLPFLVENLGVVLLLVLATLLTNTLISAASLRVLGRSWPEALYTGAVLAQIGEFSFVLAAVGREGGLIQDYAYQMTVLIIAVCLLVAPGWIMGARVIRRRASGGAPAAGAPA